jgi:hypothetical protein
MIIKSHKNAIHHENLGKLFAEKVHLAHTQKKEKKDIPEFGWKGVVLLNEDSQGGNDLIAFQKKVSGLMDVIVRKDEVVDNLGRRRRRCCSSVATRAWRSACGDDGQAAVDARHFPPRHVGNDEPLGAGVYKVKCVEKARCERVLADQDADRWTRWGSRLERNEDLERQDAGDGARDRRGLERKELMRVVEKASWTSGSCPRNGIKVVHTDGNKDTAARLARGERNPLPKRL